MNRNAPLTRSAPPVRRTELARSSSRSPAPPAARVTLAAVTVPDRPKPRPRRDTGFSPATKLLIRSRAGNGDPAEAHCEAGYEFLGLHGGEFQHRRARGRGGSRDPVTSSAANGALLCHRCHALAESRDAASNEAGWWLWSWQSPADEPVLLAGADGGIRVWLTAAGGYSTTAPGES